MQDNLQCTLYLNGKRIRINLEPLPDGNPVVVTEDLDERARPRLQLSAA